MPQYSALERKQINKKYAVAIDQIKDLGFVESKATKSKILSLTLVTSNVKAYISVRHDYQKDISAAIGEFFCKSKTDTDAVGGEIKLVRFTPKNNTVKFYQGMDLVRCQSDFIRIAGHFIKAFEVAKSMSKL